MLLQTHLDRNPKRADHWKSAYVISYSLEWLNILSWELFVLGSRSNPHFNKKTHFFNVLLNYKSFQINWR